MDFPIATLSLTSGARLIDSTGERLTYPGGEGDQIRIANAGPDHVCVLGGAGAQLAVFPTSNATPNGAGTVILAGSTEVFTAQGITDIHAITLSGKTATIFMSRVKGA